MRTYLFSLIFFCLNSTQAFAAREWRCLVINWAGETTIVNMGETKDTGLPYGEVGLFRLLSKTSLLATMINGNRRLIELDYPFRESVESFDKNSENFGNKSLIRCTVEKI